MSLSIISPHLDDAIFSLGEHLSFRPGATVICPFAGTPTDRAGKLKYNRLHYEHVIACKALNLEIINGPFLDDVYADTRDISSLTWWLRSQLHAFTEIWVPVGIHHLDHILSARAARTAIDGQSWSYYEELPYRVLYPEQATNVQGELMGAPHNLDAKKTACRLYESQVGEDIERCLYVPERLWKMR